MSGSWRGFRPLRFVGEVRVVGAAVLDHVGKQIVGADHHQHMMRQLCGPGLVCALNRAQLRELLGSPMADQGFDGKAIELLSGVVDRNG